MELFFITDHLSEELIKLNNIQNDLDEVQVIDYIIQNYYNSKINTDFDDIISLINLSEENNKLYNKINNDFDDISSIVDLYEKDLTMYNKINNDIDDIHSIINLSELNTKLYNNKDNDLDDVISILFESESIRNIFDNNDNDLDEILHIIDVLDRIYYKNLINDFEDLYNLLGHIAIYKINIDYTIDYTINISIEVVPFDYELNIEVI